MRKLILLICVFMTSAMMQAQDDCMAFFPSEKGTVLINKSYDANDNLQNIITYTVNGSNQTTMGENMEITCDITDAQGMVIDKGMIDASCMDGNFYLKMKNQAVTSDFFELLGCNTQLVGNFLDYPNTFNDGTPFQDYFTMDPGEYTVKSKENDEKMTVKVYNRQYEKAEKITTPAGTFHASKISFSFDSDKDKKITKHKGVEWYAEGAGIVRSETYDDKGNLESYTVLTNLQTR